MFLVLSIANYINMQLPTEFSATFILLYNWFANALANTTRGLFKNALFFFEVIYAK